MLTPSYFQIALALALTAITFYFLGKRNGYAACARRYPDWFNARADDVTRIIKQTFEGRGSQRGA
jgi:hypothetical protein